MRGCSCRGRRASRRVVFGGAGEDFGREAEENNFDDIGFFQAAVGRVHCANKSTTASNSGALGFAVTMSRERHRRRGRVTTNQTPSPQHTHITQILEPRHRDLRN